ncbi:MAG: 1-acyl-sn-glycerol-3-phosphate acyltransferase [Gemmatimonadaceae bacterium]
MISPVFIEISAALLAAFLIWRYTRSRLDLAARRSILHFRSRLDRFKLVKKPDIIAALLADPDIALEVESHARENGVSISEGWKKVRRYLDEIIPFFNVLAYYRLGYQVSRILLNLFYKVSVEYERPDPFKGLPRDSTIIYLMNHRSNADYIVVAYALAGDVSISYAVGEWARAFPLEYIFKSFGSYFIRRRYREPLYHRVLERYVQLITRKGVTQGIFPEGGLSRDGKLRPAKIGLLDYVLGVGRDPGIRSRMFVVPVALNYDRVLEDRSLLRELGGAEGEVRPSRLKQLGEVTSYLLWNTGRLISRRWKRYGRAAVTIGAPIALNDWFQELESKGIDLYAVDRTARLGEVQRLCDGVMDRIGAIIPVTPVPLACAAIQTFASDFIGRPALIARMEELQLLLVELNARVVRADRAMEETFERAYRMLRMRKVLARQGDGFLVLPRGRPLVSYYANSIAHLLGPYAAGIREREAFGAAFESM